MPVARDHQAAEQQPQVALAQRGPVFLHGTGPDTRRDPSRGQALDHDGLRLARRPDLGAHALQEVIALERHHAHRRDGADRRRPRAAAQQRDLAEVLARTLLADLRVVDEHRDRAVLDHVEALGLVALGDDRLAGVEAASLGADRRGSRRSRPAASRRGRAGAAGRRSPRRPWRRPRTSSAAPAGSPRASGSASPVMTIAQRAPSGSTSSAPTRPPSAVAATYSVSSTP